MKKTAIVLLVLGCFVMFQACASAPKLPESQPGLYVNPEFRFSVNYPENWTAEPLQAGEVLRAANPNLYKVPVITASVADLAEGASLDTKAFTVVAQAAQTGSKRYKVLSEEDITLNDGTPAKAFTYKWTWTDGVSKLVTAAVISIKDDKFFTTTVTTLLGGETKPEQLLEIVKSWKFYQ
ncbi:MAG: hypothetical protein JRE12_07470 [Deltaproteobacteria bacterium]|nr:hypothetical protein [Deltaproteobacteria bacterium]